MGSKKRFDLFSRLIHDVFTPKQYPSIADIAGGKGYLQLSLREKGFQNVTTFDKRKKNKRVSDQKIRFSYRYFNEQIKEKFDLLVGLHPDEATDVIIMEAAKRRIPFVLCPCCVKPSAVTYWGSHKFTAWVNHLKKLARSNGFRIEERWLKMDGKNYVLIGIPI